MSLFQCHKGVIRSEKIEGLLEGLKQLRCENIEIEKIEL